MQNAPSGKPDVLYFVPESVATQDYSSPVDMDEIEIAEDMYAERPQEKGCSPHFKQLAEMIQEDEDLEQPTNAEEALQLYFDLLDHIDDSQQHDKVRLGIGCFFTVSVRSCCL